MKIVRPGEAPAPSRARRPPLPTVAPTWSARHPPLRASAVAAVGPAARALAEDALRGLREGRRFAADLAEDALVLRVLDDGPPPWCDGAVFLGVEAGVEALLVPTARAPSVPMGLLAGALLSAGPAGEAPLAVLPGSGLVLGLGPPYLISEDDLIGAFPGLLVPSVAGPAA